MKGVLSKTRERNNNNNNVSLIETTIINTYCRNQRWHTDFHRFYNCQNMSHIATRWCENILSPLLCCQQYLPSFSNDKFGEPATHKSQRSPCPKRTSPIIKLININRMS